MHNFYTRWKQECLCSSHLGDLMLLFGCGDDGLFHGDDYSLAAGSCLSTHIWLSMIMFDGNSGSQACLKCLGTYWHVSHASHSGGGKNLAAVCCVFRLSFRMLWMDLDIPDMVATSQLGFVFLSVLLISVCLGCLESSVLGHTFWTEMTLKNLCCSCYLLSRSFSQHFRSSCSIFFNLK